MTQLVYGARQIGGAPSYKNIPEKKAYDILLYAYEKGIRCFDTAPIYGNGMSEKFIGKYLGGVRKEIQIITKFGCIFDTSGKITFDFSTQGILDQVEQSLARLRTDYIDTYLLHIPEGNINVDEVITTLNLLKSQGIIRKYGLCNTYGDLLQKFLSHPDAKIESIQDFYNIIEKKAEKLIFPHLSDNCDFMAYSPLYRGLLTSTEMRDLLLRNEEAIARLMPYSSLPFLVKQKKIYEEIAKIKGVSLEKIAVDFLKGQSKVSHIVFGTTNKEHLDLVVELIK